MKKNQKPMTNRGTPVYAEINLFKQTPVEHFVGFTYPLPSTNTIIHSLCIDGITSVSYSCVHVERERRSKRWQRCQMQKPLHR